MDGQEHRTTDEEDFYAEVSDVRAPADIASSPPTQALFARLTRRQRSVRVGVIVCAVLLALAVILGGFPGLRQRALGLVPGLETTPTAPLAPGDDLFYLLPNPPGVVVAVDGHLLASLPFPGDPHPLRLVRGAHIFSWRSRLFPFAPLRCRVSVPHAATDTCPIVVGQSQLPVGLVGVPGTVIGMQVSLRALPSGTNAAAQLPAAIQAALDTERSTAIVRPGERYFTVPPGQAGAPATATQPLRATRSVQLLTDAGYPEPCILTQPAIPCRFPGQDCGQLCTVTHPPTTVAGSGGAWVVAATVRASWDYQTLDGQVVARDVTEAFGVQLAVLRITWDTTGWHVTPIVGHIPGFDAADDAVCDPARYALAGTPSWSFMMTDPLPGATVQFVSDATPTDGCAAVLTHGAPAIFLERFGVLMTVNDAAINPTDNLPVADATEQHLARHLLAVLAP